MAEEFDEIIPKAENPNSEKDPLGITSTLNVLVNNAIDERSQQPTRLSSFSASSIDSDHGNQLKKYLNIQKPTATSTVDFTEVYTVPLSDYKQLFSAIPHLQETYHKIEKEKLLNSIKWDEANKKGDDTKVSADHFWKLLIQDGHVTSEGVFTGSFQTEDFAKRHPEYKELRYEIYQSLQPFFPKRLFSTKQTIDLRPQRWYRTLEAVLESIRLLRLEVYQVRASLKSFDVYYHTISNDIITPTAEEKSEENDHHFEELSNTLRTTDIHEIYQTNYSNKQEIELDYFSRLNKLRELEDQRDQLIREIKLAGYKVIGKKKEDNSELEEIFGAVYDNAQTREYNFRLLGDPIRPYFHKVPFNHDIDLSDKVEEGINWITYEALLQKILDKVLSSHVLKEFIKQQIFPLNTNVENKLNAIIEKKEKLSGWDKRRVSLSKEYNQKTAEMKEALHTDRKDFLNKWNDRKELRELLMNHKELLVLQVDRFLNAGGVLDESGEGERNWNMQKKVLKQELQKITSQRKSSTSKVLEKYRIEQTHSDAYDKYQSFKNDLSIAFHVVRLAFLSKWNNFSTVFSMLELKYISESVFNAVLDKETSLLDPQYWEDLLDDLNKNLKTILMDDQEIESEFLKDAEAVNQQINALADVSQTEEKTEQGENKDNNNNNDEETNVNKKTDALRRDFLDRWNDPETILALIKDKKVVESLLEDVEEYKENLNDKESWEKYKVELLNKLDAITTPDIKAQYEKEANVRPDSYENLRTEINASLDKHRRNFLTWWNWSDNVLTQLNIPVGTPLDSILNSFLLSLTDEPVQLNDEEDAEASWSEYLIFLEKALDSFLRPNLKAVFDQEKMKTKERYDTLVSQRHNIVSIFRHEFLKQWNDYQKVVRIAKTLNLEIDPNQDLLARFLAKTNLDESEGSEVLFFQPTPQGFYNQHGQSLENFMLRVKPNQTIVLPDRDEMNRLSDELIMVVSNPLPGDLDQSRQLYPSVQFIENYQVVVKWEGHALGELTHSVNLLPSEAKVLELTKQTKLSRKISENSNISKQRMQEVTSSFEDNLTHEMSDINRDESSASQSDVSTASDVQKSSVVSTTRSSNISDFNMGVSASFGVGFLKVFEGGVKYGKRSEDTTRTENSKQKALVNAQSRKHIKKSKKNKEQMKKDVSNLIQRASSKTSRENTVMLKKSVTEEFEETSKRVEKITVSNPNSGKSLNFHYFQLQNKFSTSTVLKDVKVVVDFGRELVDGTGITDVRVFDLDEIGKLSFQNNNSRLSILLLGIIMYEAFENYLYNKDAGYDKDANAPLQVMRGSVINEQVKGLLDEFVELMKSDNATSKEVKDSAFFINAVLARLQKVQFAFRDQEILTLSEHYINAGAMHVDSQLSESSALEPYLQERRQIETERERVKLNAMMTKTRLGIFQQELPDSLESLTILEEKKTITRNGF